MSPDNKLRKGKLKEKNRPDKSKETLEPIKERKTLTRKNKKTSELDSKKKRKRDKETGVDSNNVDGIDREEFDPEHKVPEKEKKSKLGMKKKRRKEKGNEVDASIEDQIHTDKHANNGMMHSGGRPKSDRAKRSTHSQTLREDENSEKPNKASNVTKIKTKKSKKEMKLKNEYFDIAKERKSEKPLGEVDEEKVEEILVVDEDCSRGMKMDGIYREDMGQEHKVREKKKNKLGMKKKRRRGKGNVVDASNEDQIHADEHADNGMMHSGSRLKSDHTKRSTHYQTLSEGGNSEKPKETSNGAKIKTKKVKKEKKHKNKDINIAEERKSEEKLGKVDEEKVEEIPSVDEDSARGMKKWLIKYKESRPGLKILQERIDDFITAHEEQQEQERKETEARAAEGGWTVVVHHKGRKKTTDTETGVTVGSVSQAAVVDKMGKKKSKEVPLDFYRFQKREAQRKEVMMLQSKFEQDKKRIQQLRAARKFRPY